MNGWFEKKKRFENVFILSVFCLNLHCFTAAARGVHTFCLLLLRPHFTLLPHFWMEALKKRNKRKTTTYLQKAEDAAVELTSDTALFVCLFVFVLARNERNRCLQATRENCWASTYMEGSGGLLRKKSEGVGGIQRSCVVVCWSHCSNMCPPLANNTKKNWLCYCCFCYYFFIIFAAASSVFSCLHFQPFFRFALCGEEDGRSKVDP